MLKLTLMLMVMLLMLLERNTAEKAMCYASPQQCRSKEGSRVRLCAECCSDSDCPPPRPHCHKRKGCVQPNWMESSTDSREAVSSGSDYQFGPLYGLGQSSMQFQN